MKNLPENPFESIALCMSGGGYRAASFHLGAMAYLHRVGLLENVKAISTVSGGTITGVMYAYQKEEGRNFESIYDGLIHLLKTRDLIKEGLSKLKREGQWDNPFKRRNLINAFAEIYDKHFTEGNTFDLLDADHMNSHLELVVFNATEFNHGINFRFQNDGVMGNNYVKVPKVAHEEVKLSDVIAASSCFPGGFEPIGFPGDFMHERSNALAELKDDKYPQDVGIMDGGIYDNQGIDAILLSEKRRRKVYDLIIISDVSSADMSPFSFETLKPSRGFRNKNLRIYLKSIRSITLGAILLIVAVACLAVIIAWISGFENNIGTGIGIGLVSAATVILTIFLWIRYQIKKRLNDLGSLIKDKIPSFYFNHLTRLNLTDYKIGEYEPLVLDRIQSLLKLLQDVFLKQIRRLNYAKIYESEVYEYRRISNLSKELTDEYLKKSIAKLQALPNCPTDFKASYDQLLGDSLAEIINDAASFGTNLWFTQDDVLNQMLDKLLVSGQFNMCFNLLVYTLELESSSDFYQYEEEKRTKIADLRDQLISDWNQFVSQPYFLIESSALRSQ
ncbi:patatin-like phospholipase family protein [Portibacter marinus]|uniref:patatin-like phospholipase family protein n=1 Tax=Portibacter marinus TaxID=2898660 RepID=UPI001F2FA601|nr:patatin-like phospholipase family protein [Portibacter marinus]